MWCAAAGTAPPPPPLDPASAPGRAPSPVCISLSISLSPSPSRAVAASLCASPRGVLPPPRGVSLKVARSNSCCGGATAVVVAPCAPHAEASATVGALTAATGGVGGI
eukprot:6355890-Prymnesium_polylepis.1